MEKKHIIVIIIVIAVIVIAGIVVGIIAGGGESSDSSSTTTKPTTTTTTTTTTSTSTPTPCPSMNMTADLVKTGPSIVNPGDVLTFSCGNSKTLWGPTALECKADSTYNDSAVPYCYIPCAAITMGTDLVINEGIFSVKPGDVLTFSCNNSQTLGGPSSLLCNNDGSYNDSDTEPFCYTWYCNDGEMVDTKCIRTVNSGAGLSQSAAQSQCALVTGWTIADVDSANIQAKVAAITRSAWIGVTRASPSANFEWVNSGAEVQTGYDNWDSTNSEPGSSETCGFANSAETFKWAEKACSDTDINDVICQAPRIQARSYTCQTGDLVDTNKCLHFVSGGAADYASFESNCDGVDMKPVKIYSQEIQDYLAREANGVDVWIGAKRDIANSVTNFAWEYDGETVSAAGFEFWVTAGAGSTDDCAVADSGDDFKWKEFSCTDSSNIQKMLCIGEADGVA